MGFDSDLVRVDLLKVKRKLYLSYPKNSQERRDFLLASKLSEIGYLSKAVPTELATYAFDEYKSLVKKKILTILVNMGLGLLLSVGLLFLHIAYPKNVWLNMWSVGFWVGFFNSIKHGVHIVEQWKTIQPFKKEYNALQEKIKKLSGELKKLK